VRSWVSADIYRPIPRNVLFYDGPSMLTGARILAIATAQNGNRKIGHMLQLWIMPAISPIAAVRLGADAAVCGDCRLRGDGHGAQRTCYVEYWRAVENIWQAREKARQMTPSAFGAVVRGLQLRIGAYGDPVAIPLHVWRPLLAAAGGWTAYTHQWRTAHQDYRAWCMASVDSLEEQREASALGWRTFRIRQYGDDLQGTEVICPASEEGGHRAVCADCELCRGAARQAKHIAIKAHGSGAKWFPARLVRPAASTATT
jgi:hypothetical protein